MDVNQEREVTVVDVFFAIKKRIKLIAFVTLLAIILGAAGGVALTLLSNANYGTTAEFRIKSAENNELILSLLKSDRFAEKLLLDKLHEDDDYVSSLSKKDKEKYETYKDLLAKIEEMRAGIKERKKELRKLTYELNLTQRAYDDANASVTEAQTILGLYLSPEQGVLDEAKKVEYETLLENAKKTRDDAKKKYDAKYLECQTTSFEMTEMMHDYNEVKKEFDAAEHEYLEKFRKDSQNSSMISMYKDALNFNFEKPDATDVNSTALLLVDISVPFKEEVAEEIVSAIPVAIPEFIEFYVSEPYHDEETVCTYISVFDDATSINKESLVSGAIKFALIAAILVFVCMSLGVAFFEISIKPHAKKENVTEDTSKEAIPEQTDEEAAEAIKAEEVETEEKVEETETNE